METDQQLKTVKALFEKGLDYFYLKNNAKEALKCLTTAIKIEPNYHQAYRERANIQRYLGNQKEALVDVERSIGICSKNECAYYIKARILIGLGKKEEANKCMILAEDQVFEDALSYFHKAAALKDLNKMEEALYCYDKAIQLNPNYASAYNSKGLALYELGKKEQALYCYDKAIQIDPSSASAHYNKGNALRDLDEIEEALFCYDKAIQLNSSYDSAYYNKGNIFRNLGKNEEALDCYDKAIRLKPTFDSAHYNKGNVLRNLGKNEEALDCYNKAIQLNPNYASAYNSKGLALSKLGKKEQALYCYDKAIQIDPSSASTHYNKGNAHYELRQMEQALDCFDKTIQLDPSSALAYYNKANILRVLNKQEEALYCYEKTIQLNPNFVSAYYNKGNTLRELGKAEEALHCFDQVLRLDPSYDNSSVCISKANALRDLGKNEEALFCYDEAIKLNPAFASAYYNKGNTLRELGKAKEALRCFDQALQLNPKLISAYYSKGNTLRDLGKNEEALSCYDMALRLNPNFVSAYNSKANIFRDLGKKEEALLCYEKAITLKPDSALYYFNKGGLLSSLGRDEQGVKCFNKAYELSQNGNLADKDITALLKKIKELGIAFIETEKACEMLNSANETATIFLQTFGKLKQKRNKLTLELLTDLNDDSLSSTSIKKNLKNKAAHDEQIFQMKEEILALKQQILDYQATVDQQLDKHENAVDQSRVYAKAEVSQGFKDLETKNPELYIYCKTFYWTTINLFGAYRSISIDLVQGNPDAGSRDIETLLGAGAQKMASYGVELAKGLPFVGGVIGALDKIVETLYNVSKENEFVNRVNAINMVIQNKVGPEDDISISIGKLTIVMTEARKQAIMFPDTTSPSKFKEAFSLLNKKIDQIKTVILPQIELNNQESQSVTLALSDAALFISYLCKNYQLIIQTPPPLEEQLVEIMKFNNLDQMLKGLEQPQHSGDSNESNFESKNDDLKEDRKKLKELLAKQTFSSKADQKNLYAYYNGFLQTFEEVYLTSQLISNEVDLGKELKVGVFSTLVAFISVAEVEQSKDLRGLDQLMTSQEMVSCAKKIILLAKDSQTLSVMVSECALEIIKNQGKQKRIVSLAQEDKDLLISFEQDVNNKLLKILGNEPSAMILSKLYNNTYQTLAAKKGHFDALKLIQLCISQKVDLLGSKESIKQQFINEITRKGQEEFTSQIPCLASCRRERCQVF